LEICHIPFFSKRRKSYSILKEKKGFREKKKEKRSKTSGRLISNDGGTPIPSNLGKGGEEGGL